MSFFDKLILSFCRLGVAGLDPKAPGTWGTAIACLLAPYIFLPLSLPWRAALLVAIFVLGGLAATRAEHLLARKDPGEVVIDELVGVWLVLLPFESPVSGWCWRLLPFSGCSTYGSRGPCGLRKTGFPPGSAS